jgi:hypothetical protein
MLAVLSAVLSAGAAEACCFFKCLGRPAPAAAPRMQATSGGYGGGLTITYVAGQQVVSDNVPNPVNPHAAFDVIVDEDYSLGPFCDPELTFTDNGPHTAVPAPGPAPAAAPAGTVVNPKYTKSRKTKYKAVVIGGAMSSGGASSPPPGSTVIWIPYYECTYSIDANGLNPGRNYSVYASCGTVKSNTVTFYTSSP